MKEEIIDRLEWFSEGSDTEHEVWVDPVTGNKYRVEIEITRDFKNMSEI